jgi:hypothetical protein
VQKLQTAGLVEQTREQRPYEYNAESIVLTLSTNEDIDAFIERYGLDGLAAALEYAYEYVDGTVNHRIAARKLDLSSLEAEIILQALEPVATEYPDADI